MRSYPVEELLDIFPQMAVADQVFEEGQRFLVDLLVGEIEEQVLLFDQESGVSLLVLEEGGEVSLGEALVVVLQGSPMGWDTHNNKDKFMTRPITAWERSLASSWPPSTLR